MERNLASERESMDNIIGKKGYKKDLYLIGTIEKDVKTETYIINVPQFTRISVRKEDIVLLDEE
jgi:hypothetical protein